jgi:hypothetical protein
MSAQTRQEILSLCLNPLQSNSNKHSTILHKLNAGYCSKLAGHWDETAPRGQEKQQVSCAIRIWGDILSAIFPVVSPNVG